MAKWIKYQIVCNEEKNILLNKKLEYSEANLVIAQNEAYGNVYEIIEDDKVIDKEPLAIELGGTNAKTAEEAREKLGLTLENMGAIAIDLLWENASLTSTFPAQNINVPTRADYDLLLVMSHYAGGVNNKNTYACCFIKNEVEFLAYLNGLLVYEDSSTKGIVTHQRKIDVRDTYLIVGDCLQCINSNVGTSVGPLNTRSIPHAIYGIKGVQV